MQSTSSDFLPFHLPLIEEDDIRAVREVMETGWITTGPKAAQFEKEFGQYVGARHSIAVSSCTSALHLALDAIGVREGDEVIVPTLTFAATAETVIYCKARPVLVDSEPGTFNIDPAQVERAITPRTRAIVPVHLGGHPCEMDALLEIARAHGLKVIEDAAHALPARYRGRMVGTLGDLTCFSFYATKTITTAEGGMVTTDADGWDDRMRTMRLHGISKDAWKRYTAEGSWRYEIQAPGFKYNLTDMQAALGLSQLAKCDSMWARRCQMAARYTEELGNLDVFELPTARPHVQHAWHLYVLRVCRNKLNIHRDRVIEELKQRGIGSSVHFIPLHLHPYYRDQWGYRRGDFPVVEEYFDRCVSMPLYPAMSDDDQTRVIEALKDIARQHRRTPIAMVEAVAERVRIAAPSLQAGSASRMEEAAAETPEPALDGPIPLRGWYRRGGKRLLDLLGAAAGLVVLAPFMILCAVAVRLSSPGPVFFRQGRVGRNGRLFDLFKLRTMYTDRRGPRVTAAGDPRITPIGRWLRRTKLDELPQLINVLKGDMSLVGPRPEVSEYVAGYTNRQKKVLLCRPGITSPASLAFIDEEALLAAQSDHESYYTQVLLPRKLEIDLAYCHACSLRTDLELVAHTVGRLIHGEPAPLPAAPALNASVKPAEQVNSRAA